jgi:hypothetical protein
LVLVSKTDSKESTVAESVNRLTDEEIMASVKETLEVVGLKGAGSVAWMLLEAEAEKITSDVQDPKRKRHAELIYIRMVLDTLESNYREEKEIHEGGEEPTYDAG